MKSEKYTPTKVATIHEIQKLMAGLRSKADSRNKVATKPAAASIAPIDTTAAVEKIRADFSGQIDRKNHPNRENGEVTRAEFDELSPIDRSRLILAGGKIVDDSEPAAVVRTQPTITSSATKLVTRTEWDAMPRLEASQFLLNGGKII